MAPIRARTAATGSCCRATRPVAARASSRGKSPSTSAPAPIAAIIRNHSRRVPLVTVPFTLHLASRVVVQYALGALVSVTIKRPALAADVGPGGNEARNDLGLCMRHGPLNVSRGAETLALLLVALTCTGHSTAPPSGGGGSPG